MSMTVMIRQIIIHQILYASTNITHCIIFDK